MNARSHQLRQEDPILLAARWGALWGVAIGLWLLAPALIEDHRLRPEGIAQWAVLTLSLCVIFAVLGALCALFGGFALMCAEAATGRTLRDRGWAYGLFAGVLAVPAYAASSFMVHWQNSRTLGLGPYREQAIAMAIAWLVALLAFIALYRWVVRKEPRLQPQVLGWALAVLSIAAALLLVARSRSELTVHGPVRLSPLAAAAASPPPLLFVGIDGATWRAIGPAIEQGFAPTFKALQERGVRGTTEALWPPYWSGAAWAAILTGLPRDITGVYEDLAGTAPGLPPFQVSLSGSLRLNPIYVVRSSLLAARVLRYVPHPRAILNGQPVWEMLHAAGIDSAVVRFQFTYPPAGRANIVVSDWIGRDHWEGVGVRRPPTAGTVAPADRARELAAAFEPDASAHAALYAELLPGPTPRLPPGTIEDPFEQLRQASDIDRQSFDVSERILRGKPLQPFFALYVGGLDAVQHAFWEYRFPEDFPQDRPDQEDVGRLGPVLDRYVRFLDRRLGELITLYETEPNVLIVSDHGQGPNQFPGPWRGWHTKDGLFLLSGPSVQPDEHDVRVSYFDIVPTILALKGFEQPRFLEGSVLPPVSRTLARAAR